MKHISNVDKNVHQFIPQTIAFVTYFYCSLFDFYSFKTIANKFVVKVDYFSASCRHIDYECTFLFIAISTAKIVLMTIFINM